MIAPTPTPADYPHRRLILSPVPGQHEGATILVDEGDPFDPAYGADLLEAFERRAHILIAARDSAGLQAALEVFRMIADQPDTTDQ